MKIEYVPAVAKVAEVPLVSGGIYLCHANTSHYMLSESRAGGYQLATIHGGVVMTQGPFDTKEGTLRYLNDSYPRWTYVPEACIAVPKPN